jgi:hypothetical protein
MIRLGESGIAGFLLVQYSAGRVQAQPGGGTKAAENALFAASRVATLAKIVVSSKEK